MHAVHACRLAGFACDVQWHGLSSGLSTGLSSGLSTGLFTGLSTDFSTGLSSGLSTDLSIGLCTDLSTGLSTGVASIVAMITVFWMIQDKQRSRSYCLHLHRNCDLSFLYVQRNAQHHCDHTQVICNAFLFKRELSRRVDGASAGAIRWCCGGVP